MRELSVKDIYVAIKTAFPSDFSVVGNFDYDHLRPVTKRLIYIRGIMYEVSDENDMQYWKVGIINDNTEHGNIEIRKLQSEDLAEIAALAPLVRYIKEANKKRGG